MGKLKGMKIDVARTINRLGFAVDNATANLNERKAAMEDLFGLMKSHNRHKRSLKILNVHEHPTISKGEINIARKLKNLYKEFKQDSNVKTVEAFCYYYGIPPHLAATVRILLQYAKKSNKLKTCRGQTIRAGGKLKPKKCQKCGRNLTRCQG